MLSSIIFVGVSIASCGVVDGDAPVRDLGTFLQGAIWYKLDAPVEIGAESQAATEKWDRQTHEAYLRSLAGNIQRKKFRSDRAFENAQRQFVADQRRYREDAKESEIASAAALNALLADLSAPEISSARWRDAKVELPSGFTVKSLAMQIAPGGRDKGSVALGRSVICLGRLEQEGRWPDYLEGSGLDRERAAYDAAFRAVKAECVAGTLKLESIAALDKAILDLKDAITRAIPTARKARVNAYAFQAEIKSTASIFDAETMEFAKELLRDTQRQEATTVHELVAFMRKYRLMFAAAGVGSPTAEVHESLYPLLREQARKLGAKPAVDLDFKPVVPADAVTFGAGRYKAFEERLGWKEAKAKCESMGGRLAVVKSPDQHEFVHGLALKARLKSVWLGATDEGHEGVWTWLDGTQMTWGPWKQGQPNNVGYSGEPEHYLLSMTEGGGDWWDVSDQSAKGHGPGFICEWAGR